MSLRGFFCVNLPNLHNSFVILNAIAGFFFTPMSQRVEAVAHSDKIYALAVMLCEGFEKKERKEDKENTHKNGIKVERTKKSRDVNAKAEKRVNENER